MSSLPDIDPAITADEIGIETARLHGFVLRSAFQLVFRPDGGMLHAVAAEGFLRPFRDGAPFPPRPFLDSLEADGRAFAGRLGMALHLGNHRHLGLDGLDHVLAVGAPLSGVPARELVGWLATLLDEAEMPAAQLVCAIREPASFGTGALAVLASELRALGARIAVGGLDDGHPPLDGIRRVAADIVRIEGGWFRRVCESEGALRLLAGLVRGFKAEGAQVLIEGIETRRQLAAALDAGADLVQGFLLSRPELAGTALDTPSLALADILPEAAKVIPLFGGR